MQGECRLLLWQRCACIIVLWNIVIRSYWIEEHMGVQPGLTWWYVSCNRFESICIWN